MFPDIVDQPVDNRFNASILDKNIERLIVDFLKCLVDCLKDLNEILQLFGETKVRDNALPIDSFKEKCDFLNGKG